MSITEEQRHRLIRALERELGEEEASSLMELVPQVPWSDVATTRDLTELASKIDMRFEHQDALWRAEFGRLEARIDVSDSRVEAMIADAVNRLTFRMLPAMATMIAIFGAIAALY